MSVRLGHGNLSLPPGIGPCTDVTPFRNTMTLCFLHSYSRVHVQASRTPRVCRRRSHFWAGDVVALPPSRREVAKKSAPRANGVLAARTTTSSRVKNKNLVQSATDADSAPAVDLRLVGAL